MLQGRWLRSTAVQRSLGILLALSAVTVIGCSDSDDSAEASCIDLTVEAYNSVDLSGIDADDGFDAEEKATFEQRIQRSLDSRPPLAEGGQCRDQLEAAEVDPQVAERVPPEFLEAVRAHGEALVAELTDS